MLFTNRCVCYPSNNPYKTDCLIIGQVHCTFFDNVQFMCSTTPFYCNVSLTLKFQTVDTRKENKSKK